jgi:hypothetical protein
VSNTTDARRIASGLSAWEKQAVIALCDGEPVRFHDTRWFARLQRLLDLGLLEKQSAMEWRVTEMGRAVWKEAKR